MKLWTKSLERLGLKGLIFHDQLNDELVQRFSSENVSFRKVERDYVATPNDMRFFLFRELLDELEPEYAFLTDLWDVWLESDPYKVAEPGKIYVGRFGRKLDGAKVAKGHAEQTQYQPFLDLFKNHRDEWMMNAWLCGGETSLLKRFLDRFIEIHREVGFPRKNLNNLLVNYLTHTEFRNEASTELSKMGKALTGNTVPFIHGNSWIPKRLDHMRNLLGDTPKP